MSPVNKVIYGKSLVPDCNNLAYRKGKEIRISTTKNEELSTLYSEKKYNQTTSISLLPLKKDSLETNLKP